MFQWISFHILGSSVSFQTGPWWLNRALCVKLCKICNFPTFNEFKQQYSHMIDCCVYTYSPCNVHTSSCMNNKPVYTVTRKIVIRSCWQTMCCHLRAYLLIFCMYVSFDTGMRWFQTGRLGFKFVSSFAPELVIVGHRWALREFKVAWVMIFPCRIFVEDKWMRKLCRNSNNPYATLNLLWSFCKICRSTALRGIFFDDMIQIYIADSSQKCLAWKHSD